MSVEKLSNLLNMIDYKDIFGCKHPIICLPMNQVSDIDLALAVDEAGVFPSISIFNYFRNGTVDISFYKKELRRFNEKSNNYLMTSVTPEMFLENSVMSPFLEIGYKHVEIYHNRPIDDDIWKNVSYQSKIMKDKFDTKIIFKIGTLKQVDSNIVILKGIEGAGRKNLKSRPIKESFFEFRSKFPDLLVIPSGGIYESAQIKHFMDNGALAVGIGSLFAVSKESKISTDVKRKILESTISELTVQGSLNLQGLFFQVLKDDDNNFTKSLNLGIKNKEKGCVFMGHAIDHITEILSVKDIVDNLLK